MQPPVIQCKLRVEPGSNRSARTYLRDGWFVVRFAGMSSNAGPRIGVALVGVNGQVAVSTTTGAFSVCRGLVEPLGLVTQSPMFEPLGLIDLGQLRFFGWDLRGGDHLEHALSTPTLA